MRCGFGGRGGLRFVNEPNIKLLQEEGSVLERESLGNSVEVPQNEIHAWAKFHSSSRKGLPHTGLLKLHGAKCPYDLQTLWNARPRPIGRCSRDHTTELC